MKHIWTDRLKIWRHAQEKDSKFTAWLQIGGNHKDSIVWSGQKSKVKQTTSSGRFKGRFRFWGRALWRGAEDVGREQRCFIRTETTEELWIAIRDQTQLDLFFSLHRWGQNCFQNSWSIVVCFVRPDNLFRRWRCLVFFFCCGSLPNVTAELQVSLT